MHKVYSVTSVLFQARVTPVVCPSQLTGSEITSFKLFFKLVFSGQSLIFQIMLLLRILVVKEMKKGGQKRTTKSLH